MGTVGLFGWLAEASGTMPGAGTQAGTTSAPATQQMLQGFAAWFFRVFPPESVALTVLIVALVAATGLALGAIKVRGISLGIPGVMFTGLFFARLLGKDASGHTPLNENVVVFIRDFGLILFVYAVGMQVGPGFLASLRRRGLPWNLMAVGVVLLGAVISVAFGLLLPKEMLGMQAATGLFAGGTTNAPALGSASEALKALLGSEAGKAAAAQYTSPAFAIAYPFGLVGVIVAMVMLRPFFRVSPGEDAKAIEALERSDKAEPATMNVEVTNRNLDNMRLGDIPVLKGSRVVVSRVMQAGATTVATPETRVRLGDVLLAVGPVAELEDVRMVVGSKSEVDLRTVPSNLTTRQILVTHREVIGKTVAELELPTRLGVTVTRVARTGIEFTAVGNMRLSFGDRVRAVGETAALDQAAKELGDSVRELNLPRLMPIFVGIALGVFLGSLSTRFGGALPGDVKLGLAAGPMIVAIILARVGCIGSLIWYIPHNAAQMLREFGIILFLIGVGLLAGEGFFRTLSTPLGLYWLGLGAVVTLVPLLVVGLAAKIFFKVRYLHVCGLLAGSMTSPSLAFTQTMTSSEAPAVAFATVYPLTMIMRVLVGQLMVLLFCG